MSVKLRRELLLRIVVALAATALLVVTVVRQRPAEQTRWSVPTAGDPQAGADLFYTGAACSRCHSVNGVGGSLAPDLAAFEPRQSGIAQLVASMWNHAPRMWREMSERHIPQPVLSNQQAADLFTFVYTSRFIDPPGDPERGRTLFETRTCARCHESRAGVVAEHPLRADYTPIEWTQAMWDHGRRPRARTPQPQLDARDMSDLRAYVRGAAGAERRTGDLPAANPERGWAVLKAGGCLDCHAVNGHGQDLAPELGPGRRPALTIIQFASSMWNHSARMQAEAKDRGLQRPLLRGQQIADVVAFLAGLQFLEEAGSPQIGRTVFGDDGCAGCHGADAGGSRKGPPLRGRGTPVSSITLGAALWRHGRSMYGAAAEISLPWPALAGRDVGDIVAYLNSQPGIALNRINRSVNP